MLARAPVVGAVRPRVDVSLSLSPIGYIRTAKPLKFHAAHQPREDDLVERNVLELIDDADLALGLRDLDGFSRVWLLSWFHRNAAWRPLVLPPRGPKKRRGVFATRSPHRPNPLALSAVELIAVEKGRLLLGPCDLIDGTPVFDIKPYIAAYDSFPDARGGWTAEVDAEWATTPKFAVTLSPLAAEQAEWLAANWSVDFRAHVMASLARDPRPHRTRRIRKRHDARLEIGCGAWRAYFVVEGDRVEIEQLDAAFPAHWMDDEWRNRIPDREAQAAFLARWSSPYGD